MDQSRYSKISDDREYLIEGKSLDDIRARLDQQYGPKKYQIMTSKTVEVAVPGILFTKKKRAVQASYILVNDRSSSSQDFDKNKEELVKKLSELTGGISSMQELARLGKEVSELKEQISSGFTQISENQSEHKLHKNITRIQEILKDNEFSEEYIDRMTKRMVQEFTLDELNNFEEMQRTVVDWIGEGIQIEEPKNKRPPQVIVIVGPTGVGKTTTIAKVGVRYKLQNRREMEEDASVQEAVIKYMTTDHMRVGAVDQLAKWVDAIEEGNEIIVVDNESPEELKKQYNRYKDHMDYLLIDTSGYSPNDHAALAGLHKLFDVKGIKYDLYLAVSADKKTRDLKTIFQNFEPFGFTSVIVTKCDETSSLGNIISVLADKGKSVTYVTTGQEPGAIELASKIFFLKNLDGFTIDRDHLDEKFPITQEK